MEVDNNATEYSPIINCTFCSNALDGKAKILSCLHVICNNCVVKENTVSGLMCKVCSTASYGDFNAYPIAPAPVGMVVKCSGSTCEAAVVKYCVFCKYNFCQPCSMVHVSENIDHSPIFLIDYPMINEPILCSCKKKFIEVSCSECSVMICAICHLESHKGHYFKKIEDIDKEIKLNLRIQTDGLRKNLNYLIHNACQVGDFNKYLETSKRNIDEAINVSMGNLRLKIDAEIKKRHDELHKINNNYFLLAKSQINSNKKLFDKSLEENNYFINLSKSIMDYDKKFDIEFLTTSRMIINKLYNISKCIPAKQFKQSPGLKYIYEESFKTIISTIKSYGSISIESNSSQINNVEISNNPQVLENILYSNYDDEIEDSNDLDSDSSSSDYKPLLECACCNRWDETLIKCSSCYKCFHKNCHIPVIDWMDLNEWKCTLCTDVTKYSKVLLKKKSSDQSIRTISHTELKIINRILLELYCQNDQVVFRDFQSSEAGPIYSGKVENPLSLNYVKAHLVSDVDYLASLPNCLNDLYRIFSDALVCYPPDNPCHSMALKLQGSLEFMVTKWLPMIHRVNQEYSC